MIFSALPLGHTHCLRHGEREGPSERHCSASERRAAGSLGKYALCRMAAHAKEKQQRRVLWEEEAPEILEREPSQVLADKELE